MASGEDDGGIPLDIDNVHMLLQVEHEQIQKRTFTNWINAQLSKRCPPSSVADLFWDLRDGSQLLDLLEVMSGQTMRRQRGRGVFQQRANIETALNFLKKKSIKLVNINVSDVIDGRPSIILGLIWTIILRCHIEELASMLSFSSCHSSLDSLASLDSVPGSPVSASPVPAGRTSPLHRRFRVSAKKALLMWVRDQCKKVGCSISVRDFKASWRSGEVFLVILCSLRPQLVDLSLVGLRSNQENLEEAFHLAERELHIPRLLEPQDVDVKDPDEKSIMTYVAQFLQYSSDMPAPDDHLQVSPSERAAEVTSWLQQAYEELSEAWAAAEKSSYAERYQVFQNLADSCTEQRKPVMTLMAAIRRRPELSQEQRALRTAWERLDEELQRRRADLDSSLPSPLDSVALWLQRAEAALTEEDQGEKNHAAAAKKARAQQDTLKTLIKEMSYYINILDTYHNMDGSGNVIVPLQKFDEIKKRLTNIRVTAKYEGIKLEYQESHHTVLDLLGHISVHVQTWKAPYRSQETVLVLLQEWHETVERQGLLLILTDALQNLQEKASAFTSKAALGEDSQRVTREVKEAESEAGLVTQAVAAVRGRMERVVSAWDTYNNCMTSLQAWLTQDTHSHPQSPAAPDLSEWTSCQAKLNEAGNLLIEVTESATSLALAEQLSKVNMQWAEWRKRTMFEASSEPSVAPLCLQMVHSLTEEANLLLKRPLEVASVPLKATRQKLKLLSKKMADMDLSPSSSSSDFQTSHLKNLQQTLPQMLGEAERSCGELQRAVSRLEGRLAELDHWSTEALNCQQQLKEKKHKGCSGLNSTAKALVSRGLLLEREVVTEERDLQELVTHVQNTSPLQHLSSSSLQDRISESVSHCQELLWMFRCHGFQQQLETAHQTVKKPGLLVKVKAKHVDQVGNFMLHTQDPGQIQVKSPAQTQQPKTGDLQNGSNSQCMDPQAEPIIFKPQIQKLPHSLGVPGPHVHCTLTETTEEAKSMIQIQASSLSQNDPLQTQAPVECPRSPGPVPKGKETSPPSQIHIGKSKIREQPNTMQHKPSPRPPAVDHSEVRGRAQSMARSRLEKARVRLQGRIQQAIKMFSGREISESQAKKKQRALKILQPSVLEEFLCAVEGLGAFCTGPQMQDLTLLSDSVRKQWEDVRREMAAFVPILWSKISEGTPSLPVVRCETQTNILHEATDKTDFSAVLQPEVIVDGNASVEESAESLQEIYETLAQQSSSCLAAEQLKDSDEAQESQRSDTVFPSDRREQQLQGITPLRATGSSAGVQPSSSRISLQPELPATRSAVSEQPHAGVLPRPAQDASTATESTLTQSRGGGKELKPSLRAQERLLKAHLLHIGGKSQESRQLQAVVSGSTVESKQEAEWTVVAEAPQETHISKQEALDRYRKSYLAFQSQHLDEFVPDSVADSTLQSHEQQQQTFNQEAQAQDYDLEHQNVPLPQALVAKEDAARRERDWEQLTQQREDQHMSLQGRMTSVASTTTDTLLSVDDQTSLISDRLDQILSESVDMSSSFSTDSRLLSDLKDLDARLQSQMRKTSEEERQRLSPTAQFSAPHNSVHRLKQLRRQLDKVQLAAHVLNHFLATVREIKAPMLRFAADGGPSRRQCEADWEQERLCWLEKMQQKLQTAAEQSDSADSTLKAAGLTLTMAGAAVTCQGVVTSLSQQTVDMEKELQRVERKREGKEGQHPVRKEELRQMSTEDDSPQEHPIPNRLEDRSEKEAKRSRPEGNTKARNEEHKTQTQKSEEDVSEASDRRRRRRSHVKKEEEDQGSVVQRRAALLGALMEIRQAAEQGGLQEPTLPALLQRMRAFVELDRRLAGHLPELQHIRAASPPSGAAEVGQSRELEEAWEEATKAVTERLERCHILTELLKRFQSVRAELSGMLQRAESTIREQISYMGKDNLHRLHTKVQEIKTELSGLEDGIEEIRSVCRQLHTQLRHFPECTMIQFEGEADALMDRWLDISERTDSHGENLHRGLTLWAGVLQLGAEVESWTDNKLGTFAESPSFEKEEDIRILQVEITAQEENMKHFHHRASEIQTLLQSPEPPLELQVVETQMRKKLEQLKELVSEAEDVYRQMVATKEQISARMKKCSSVLQRIEDSLLTLSGSEVTTVRAQLKDLLSELQTQDEQTFSLLEDLRVLACISSPVSLQSLSAEGILLQEKVRNIQRLFSEVEEQTERNIQALNRLRSENERLEQWLQAAEGKALKEELLPQGVRPEALSQLVSSLQHSSLQRCAVVEQSSKLLQQYNNFQTRQERDSTEKPSSLSRDVSVFQTQSCVRDQIPAADFPAGENAGFQRVHSAQIENEKRFDQLVQECQQKLTSVQEQMSLLQSQAGSSAGVAADGPALEALLREVTDIERDILQIETLKDSMAASSTPEAQVSFLSQISSLQNHKRAVDSCIRRNLALLSDSSMRGAQQAEDQVSSVQTELKELSESLGNLCESSDISQLRHEWNTIQDCDKKLRELAGRIHSLQNAGEISGMPEELHAGTMSSADADAVAKSHHSLGAICRRKKQECAERAARRVKQVTSRLQKWTGTVRAGPSQAALDEGPWHQQDLREVLSERDFLQNCLGEEATRELERNAADALDESTAALERFSKHLDSHHGEVQPDKDLQDDPLHLASPDGAPAMHSPASPSLPASGVRVDSESLPHEHKRTTRDTLKTISEIQKDSPSSSQPPAVEADHSSRSTCLVGAPATNTDSLLLPHQETVCEPLAVKSETLKSVLDAQEQEQLCEDITPKKVFTIVLDVDLPVFSSLDSQRRADAVAARSGPPRGSQGPQLCETRVAEVTSVESATGCHAFNASPAANTSLGHSAGRVELDESSSRGSSDLRALIPGDVPDSCRSPGAAAAGCQFQGEEAAETVSVDDKREEATDLCHAEAQMMRSGSCTVQEDARTDDSKQMTAADTAQSMDAGSGAMAGGEIVKETSVHQSKPKLVRRVRATLAMEDIERRVCASLEGSCQQRQIQEDTEPEWTGMSLAADQQAGTMTGGSPESCKHKCSMQDILSQIQDSVERSNIINRTPHTDLSWYLKFSPGEPEIRLLRTVQKVLACRYRPAQLDVTAMRQQLQEAEDFRCCVQEQVAAMKSAAKLYHPDALKSVEVECSAALLDASATVQVKAAQLDEVRQYHKQMKIIRALLEVLAAEKDKMSSNTLGSSSFQADKLQALLKTMRQKKNMLEELLHLSSQLSVHLSDAESSGALLAQLGDVQEEWRLLDGGLKRALHHASNSTRQSALLKKEATQFKDKLEALQESSFRSNGSKGASEFVSLTTDLKLYNQLYLHLKSQSDALVHFSLGQKEKDEIKRSLRELATLLDVIKNKLETCPPSCGGISSVKSNRKLQDLIIWAKQAENHMTTGKKLALFPEEARIQIAEMKKFQMDVWSRRSKMQGEVQQMKTSDLEKEESDLLKTTEDQYEAIALHVEYVLDTMTKSLQEREKLLCQLTSMDAWLTETHAQREPCVHIDSVSKADFRRLENELKSHKSAAAEIESQLKNVETLSESSKEIAVELSPGESRYLVNRLSGLWTELDGLLAHEKATCWELEELIHERTSLDEELSTIHASLQQMAADVEKQRFPFIHQSLSTIAQWKHMLMEHQCEVQELQHCQEAKRSSLLCTIGELQDHCKALVMSAFEQDKYLHLRRQMEESRDIAKEQIQRTKDKSLSLGVRFRQCQTLLVELPLVKTQCQEAADQLEAIAQELDPSELEPERQKIRQTVETLVSWEISVTDDIKSLEAKLLLGLRFSSELPAFMEFLQGISVELGEAKAVNPDEKAIDVALRRYWVIWRNMESWMRVLEGLGRKEKINLKKHKDLLVLRNAAKHACHSQMENLSQAREALKDYQWAAQGAIGFLHNAEATFLSAPGGFLDCTEEQSQTQQALETLEDGFQAHIKHLAELLPQQTCLSRPKTEQLHITILSQLLVGRALLEAQAQLRLESLQRCDMEQRSHRKCHDHIRQHLSGLEAKLSECAAEQVTSHDKCVAQQQRAKLLMEDLRILSGKIEELRAGCPMQACGVGKGGELGALWRRWASLRRGVSLLMAHTQQRGEEWRDITTSMEQCCSFLASLQADVPDSSTVSFDQEEPQELLAQAEMHQVGLEQEQQALASLEHRLEHALSLSSSQDPISPGPVGKTLVKIQENVRSLKERNQLLVAAAQAEEQERRQVQEEIQEVEQDLLTLLPSLEACSDPSKQQELRKDLSSLKAKLKRIEDSVHGRYAETPADISRRLREVELSLQREEEKLMEKSYPVRRLNSQVVELGTSLEKVKVLLEQRSPTVNEAQKALKRVWDELDAWHSRLMLLENEAQDLSVDHPDQAHLLMDQLTGPLQLYQNAAQMVEQRTAFLSKIPSCLQDFEGIVYSATCWLDEAQSWLRTPCSLTTARTLQNQANSLQLVLDDSERIRHALRDFRPVLEEISAVCDTSSQQEKLEESDQQVHRMQRRVLEPLEQLLRSVAVVEAMEVELKSMEGNVRKIRAILSSMDDSDITLTEHLHNRQVILANVQSMRHTLEEMERCKGELHLPQGAEENLLVFSRAALLLQSLQELEPLTQQQATLTENNRSQRGPGISSASGPPEESQPLDGSSHRTQQEAYDGSNSEEEEDEENKSCHSSSSDTLTCSIPEDPDETFNSLDGQTEDAAEIKHPTEDKALESSSEIELSTKTESAPSQLGAMDINKVLGPERVPLTAVEQLTARAERRQQPTAEALLFNRHLNTDEEVCSNVLKEQNEVSISDSVLLESPASLIGREEAEEEEDKLKWSRLYSQISQKLTTLKKVQEEHQTVLSSEDGGSQGKIPETEVTSTGSASAALQRTHECITMLHHIMSTSDRSHSAGSEELYTAARRVLLCLDAVTDLLLTPGEQEPQLRLLQQECVSTELLTVAELLTEVQSSTRAAEALCPLTSLQDCLRVVQLVLTSPHKQLTDHVDVARQQQELSSNQLCLLDDFQLDEREMFPSRTDAPTLESVLGRHLRERPGEKAKLQQASGSLLQGITRLLELGEECIREKQRRRVYSHGKLPAAHCRHKKLLQVLRSQLAFVEHLFQREPETLRSQEDERLQLEARAKALQQQALEQEVASQRRIQEWTQWEENRVRLGGLLDDLEAFVSSEEPEGDDEKSAQRRLDACQKNLVRLDESRAALGLLLDQGKVLEKEPEFAATVSHAGGALELRWQSAYRRTEQEAQRCRDIQEGWIRFQTGFASFSEWLTCASKKLRTCSDVAETSDLNLDGVQHHLIKLLDVSMETEIMSRKRVSVSRQATQLLYLREADCPGLRAQLVQLEDCCSQLTSDLSRTQDQLQQRLLETWPPVKLLSNLDNWLKTAETQLSQQRDSIRKAKDAAHFSEILQHCQGLKAGMVTGQLLLDFLCQCGPQVVGVDDQTRPDRYQQITFAENLGALRWQWLLLQRQLESQMCEAEQMHQTCAGRERRLRRLHSWVEQQKKKMKQKRSPSGHTLARRTQLELEAAVARVSEVAAALQELKAEKVAAGKEEDHPCDVSFFAQTESVGQDCRDLSQQMAALSSALQHTVEEWACFDRDLREVSLHTTRVRCSLQPPPLFSLQQAQGYMVLLQRIQEQTGKGEKLWASVEKSYQSLVKILHPGTVRILEKRMEAERQQWRALLQDLQAEHVKAAETLSLWQEFTSVSDQCSLQLQQLRHRWAELSESAAPQATQAVVELQTDVGDLQGSVGKVLVASKPLIGKLEAPAANFIQSETSLLSRDVLLLGRAMEVKKKSLQEDEDRRKLFHARLEDVEQQMQNWQSELEASISDTDSEKFISELSGQFASLVDVREMSCCVSQSSLEAERLQKLSRRWATSMTRVLDKNRDLQTKHHYLQTFQDKCKELVSVQRKLENEPQSYSSLLEMLSNHQRLEAEVKLGTQLLHSVLRSAFMSMEKEQGEKRSELMAEAVDMRASWSSSVALLDQRRSSVKEQLSRWRVYRRGWRCLWKLLKDVDPFLSPSDPEPCMVHQIQNCSEDYQWIEDALSLHSAVYTKALEAGRHLCETMTESEWQSQVQSDLQELQEAWERTTSLLDRRQQLLTSAAQKWSQYQSGITSILSELEELQTKLREPLPDTESLHSDDEELVQAAELSLQRLATGLRELATTMKTERSQYVVAGDSVVLEQQLEQLHGQWEELCLKVSLRRQEIADRLNAWTIFNDKNKEFCDWLTQMENKVCHSGDLSIEEMVEKLKKDCMEEINLFSENKSHLKQLGEQLLMASNEAKQTQVQGSLLELNQRWHNLFNHIEARVKKLKETLVAVQQLDKNMSNLRSWLSRIEAELSRPVTYSVCHHHEIQKRLAEQQELQRDIEQHTEGVASVLSLCDVLLRDEDAGGGTEAESDSLQETSRSLDQRWRTICTMALDRRLRIEETWRLWCKFLNDYSQFEDWLKMAERTAASPNSADVLYTVAKEELKKFEGFQRQVHERLTQLELVNNQYRRLVRENRADRASQLKAMVHEGNRRWDALHRRVAAVLRRLKYFTSQREEFEGTKESMLVWLTELDLQLTNVEHFSESDVHHKIQQLNSFQKEITLNTERIDGLIVFGETLIQKSSPQDAALIEDELEELHSYCQEVFSRLVRFHQRLSQPPVTEKEPELSDTAFSLESSLELIGRPWLGRSQGSLPVTPIHLLTSPLERSGRETPVSVDSLPLEWDHTGDVGGSSHEEEDEEEEEEDEDERTYFSALSVSSRSLAAAHDSPRWQEDIETHSLLSEAPPTLTSTPLKRGYLRLMSQCSGSIEDLKRVSLILDDEEQPEELGLTGVNASDKQSGVIERWELLQAHSRSNQTAGPQEPQQLTSDLDDITSWLEKVIPALECLQESDPPVSIEDMGARAKELKVMQKTFARYKSVMLSVNLRAQEASELQGRLSSMNRDWSRACTGLQRWDTSLRKTLMRCQEFHETLHSLLLWLAHAESRRYAVDISHPDTPVQVLQQHRNTLTELQRELRGRRAQQASLQVLWAQLQPEEDTSGEGDDAREKLHVTGSKLKMLLRQVGQDLSSLQQRLESESTSELQGQSASAEDSQKDTNSKNSSAKRERRESSPPRSLFYRVLRAAFPLHLLLLFLLLLPCLIPLSEGEPACTGANNFARSFYPMLRYTNGPPPT
ncbi:uncharacterized protein V6R79_017666 [Siganus canaliculatus]